MQCILTDVTSSRKNKISLTDYDYQKDIQNRLLVANLREEERDVLEEILYSPLHMTIADLASRLGMRLDLLTQTLHKLLPSGLCTIQGSHITIHKEMRKYFEIHMQRFDNDFRPDMEFIQSLLKKPPIHVLPIWYAVPRTADNIFHSLIERHFKTPLHFQRYIADLHFGEPVLQQIIHDVFSSEELERPASWIIAKYALTKELFEEYMLHLEFNFVCCLRYKRGLSGWEEIVTPFHEWMEYLRFIRSTELCSIDPTQVHPLIENFSFIQDLTQALEHHDTATQALLDKLVTLGLLRRIEQGYTREEAAYSWLALSQNAKALYLYRHAYHRTLFHSPSVDIPIDKLLRELERSLTRTLDKGWVFFDDFLAGAHIETSHQSNFNLARQGRTWRYPLPCYTEAEKSCLHNLLFGLFAEAGLVDIGHAQERMCFRVSTFGSMLFAR